MEIIHDATAQPVTLTPEELLALQTLNSEFNKAKLALGDLELQKQNVFATISKIKADMQVKEKSIIDKYGVNSIINLKTGEVTQKTQ